MLSEVATFVCRRWCVPARAFRVTLEPVRGGLESTVARVRIVRSPAYAAIPLRFIVKHLVDLREQEADIYETLWKHLQYPPTVHVIGREASSRGTYLFLEDPQHSTTCPGPILGMPRRSVGRSPISMTRTRFRAIYSPGTTYRAHH
jgi:hypothetical protein